MDTLPAIEHVQRFSANVPKFYADEKMALFNRRQLACKIENKAPETSRAQHRRSARQLGAPHRAFVGTI
jgi:hypothetical protein